GLDLDFFWKNFFFDHVTFFLLLLLLYTFERQRLVTNARQPILSDANIQASSSVIDPISCWITSTNALRGRPRGRFHDGFGDIPFWMLSDTRSASCAGTPGSRRTTYPNKASRRRLIRLSMSSTPVVALTASLVT